MNGRARHHNAMSRRKILFPRVSMVLSGCVGFVVPGIYQSDMKNILVNMAVNRTLIGFKLPIISNLAIRGFNGQEKIPRCYQVSRTMCTETQFCKYINGYGCKVINFCGFTKRKECIARKRCKFTTHGCILR